MQDSGRKLNHLSISTKGCSDPICKYPHLKKIKYPSTAFINLSWTSLYQWIVLGRQQNPGTEITAGWNFRIIHCLLYNYVCFTLVLLCIYTESTHISKWHLLFHTHTQKHFFLLKFPLFLTMCSKCWKRFSKCLLCKTLHVFSERSQLAMNFHGVTEHVKVSVCQV